MILSLPHSSIPLPLDISSKDLVFASGFDRVRSNLERSPLAAAARWQTAYFHGVPCGP